MKIVFVSNFMNHHQLELSLQFVKMADFCFVATVPFNQKEVSIGYKDMNKDYDFVLCSYESSKAYAEAINRINDADVVIFGSCPFEMVKNRIQQNKPTFKYSERLLKNHKLLRKILPFYRKKIINECTKYKNNNYYLLCASAYAEGDYAGYGAFVNKCYKWGYFPKTSEFGNNLLNIVEDKQHSNNIVWCGRFIKWKHPEYVIYAARYLQKNKVDFQIKMIGDGKLKNKIERMINKYNLSNCVQMIGSVSYDKVQTEMKYAKIFLFTSDQNEGWGAVLNESMGNGCCVIANKNIGSVPFIIRDKKNGLIYKNKKMFLKNLEFACKNKVNDICISAYKTIHEHWNANQAAKNIIKLCNGDGDCIVDEPCEKINKPLK